MKESNSSPERVFSKNSHFSLSVFLERESEKEFEIESEEEDEEEDEGFLKPLLCLVCGFSPVAMKDGESTIVDWLSEIVDWLSEIVDWLSEIVDNSSSNVDSLLLEELRLIENLVSVGADQFIEPSAFNLLSAL